MDGKKERGKLTRYEQQKRKRGREREKEMR